MSFARVDTRYAFKLCLSYKSIHEDIFKAFRMILGTENNVVIFYEKSNSSQKLRVRS